MKENEPALTKTSSPAPAPDEARAVIDRVEALALLTEARRLYEAAALVHERRSVGSLESAPLAHRALASALRVLVRLAGDEPPLEFPELVERARAISRIENLLADDPGDDLLVIAEMKERFFDYTQMSTPADDRRYDRAFVRSGEVFPAVQTYLDQRLPSERQSVGAYWKLALALLASLLFGLLLGTRLGTKAAPSAAPQPGSEKRSEPRPAQRGFVATFFKDKELRDVAATRVDQSIAFDWANDAPPQLSQDDGFSIRWEGQLHVPRTGSYTFYLTSDDGSRLFVDGKLVLDSWSDHAEVTREAAAELTEGTHGIRVEYYDKLAIALVKLEWSSESFARRLITHDDLR